MSKQVKFMVTAFRDGFQSVFGARVFSKDFMPVVKAAADAGITHFEAGGGAMFQSAYFYCNENAFDVMDNFRTAAGPDAELQTLSRGINVVGLDSQPRDIIQMHAQLFKKHGITTIRNFDALNDVNNLIYSGKCIVEAGLKHEITVTMMELPPGCSGAHTTEFYCAMLNKIQESQIPYDSICFKDASGTAVPSKVYNTIAAARKMLGDKVKIVFHSHETAGTCVLAYQAALNAGADQIDLSLAPVSGGTCQPDLLTMWHALRGSEFELDIDVNKIVKLEETFKEAMKEYFMPPEATKVEPLIPFFPMPGGALTANTQMLRDNNLMHKYPEVIAAMSESVAKGGFGTSVTPVSQFYFQQAFNNVMFGPWQKIAEGYGKMALGYFGQTPIAPDPEIVKIASEQLKLQPTSDCPLDINDRNPKKGIAAAKAMLVENALPPTDENIFIAASCQDKGVTFLKGNSKSGVRKDKVKPAPVDNDNSKTAVKVDGYTVVVNGKTFGVKQNTSGVFEVNGTPYSVGVTPGMPKPASMTSTVPSPTNIEILHDVVSPLPGMVLRIMINPGSSVSTGETILVMESMKMETPINAPTSGVLVSVPVSQGDQLSAGHVLAVIKK
ncbi:MAG: biotin/lipoyl-containing protein [Victivallaceae bacterium]